MSTFVGRIILSLLHSLILTVLFIYHLFIFPSFHHLFIFPSFHQFIISFINPFVYLIFGSIAVSTGVLPFAVSKGKGHRTIVMISGLLREPTFDIIECTNGRIIFPVKCPIPNTECFVCFTGFLGKQNAVFPQMFFLFSQSHPRSSIIHSP